MPPLTHAEVLYPQLRETSASEQIERSKRVQGGFSPAAAAAQPVSYSTQSTIARAPAVEDVASARPKVPFPSWMPQNPSLVLAMIRAQDLGSRSIHELAARAREDFQLGCDQYKKASQEAIDTWVKFMEQQRSTDSWTFFSKAVSIATSAASLIGGGAVVAGAATGGTSAVFGYLLIAMGVLSIGNAVATETGAWKGLGSYLSSDQETASRIAMGFQVGGALMTVGASVLAGYASLQALQAANYVELATQTATTAGTLAGGVGSIGQGISQSRTKQAEIRHLESQERSSDHKAGVHRYTSNVELSAKEEQRAYSSAQDLAELEISMFFNR